jgi:two-component system LytT family response regulator
MPGLNGFEVLEKLEELPVIIFSTAYDKYALKAFDAHATDYLLKPYTKQRFDTAISKITFEGSNKIIDLAEDLIQSKQKYPDRIIVEKGNKYVNTAVNDITHFEAFGDYSKIYTKDNTFLSSKGLGELEQRLDPEKFLRIHRSYIVNWTAVDVIDKQGKSYLLSLKNKVQLRVSRNNIHLIRDKIL